MTRKDAITSLATAWMALADKWGVARDDREGLRECLLVLGVSEQELYEQGLGKVDPGKIVKLAAKIHISPSLNQ